LSRSSMRSLASRALVTTAMLRWPRPCSRYVTCRAPSKLSYPTMQSIGFPVRLVHSTTGMPLLPSKRRVSSVCQVPVRVEGIRATLQEVGHDLLFPLQRIAAMPDHQSDAVLLQDVAQALDHLRMLRVADSRNHRADHSCSVRSQAARHQVRQVAQLSDGRLARAAGFLRRRSWNRSGRGTPFRHRPLPASRHRRFSHSHSHSPSLSRCPPIAYCKAVQTAKPEFFC